MPKCGVELISNPPVTADRLRQWMPLTRRLDHVPDIRLTDARWAKRIGPRVAAQQHTQHGDDAGAERIQVVAALEHQHDPPAAALFREPDQTLGYRGISDDREIQRSQ